MISQQVYNPSGGAGALPASVAAQYSAPAPAAAAAAYVVSIITKRRTGGWVDTVQIMSDGSQRVIDSIQDFSARDSVLAMFRNAGLDESFISGLMAAVDGVYSANVAPTDAQVLNSIYNSQAYKTRFAGNELIKARIAKGEGRPGDRMLTPKEYMDLEASYKTILQDAGMPTGYYDQASDFTKMIGSGISAGELKSRVEIAYDAMNNADEGTKQALKKYYNMTDGEMVAYLLDPVKAMPLIQGKKMTNDFGINSLADMSKMYGAARVGGAASRSGVNASQGISEEIYSTGQANSAATAFGAAAAQEQDVSRLGRLYGSALGTEDIVRENLNLTGGAEAGRKRRKFASKERAKFGGSSAVDKTSLSRQTSL